MERIHITISERNNFFANACCDLLGISKSALFSSALREYIFNHLSSKDIDEIMISYKSASSES